MTSSPNLLPLPYLSTLLPNLNLSIIPHSSFLDGSRPLEFEDHLPFMAEKLGNDSFMEELCRGFRLLMDPGRGVITFESLKQGAGLLGLEGLSDHEPRGMLREGDVDGDGTLSEMEFCVLMVRLSPELMEGASQWDDQAFLDGGFHFLFS